MKFILWPEVVEELKKSLSSEVIDHWFNSIIDVEKQDNIVCIQVINNLQAEWMNSQYSKIIIDALFKTTGEHLSVCFSTHEKQNQNNFVTTNNTSINNAQVLNSQNNLMGNSQNNSYNSVENTKPQNNFPLDNQEGINPENYKPHFNPRYTFETFVVGNSNRFAHAAALAVADRPTQSYNPLFLYGPSGLGKTHLMHAIAHRIQELRPNANVLYISTETFTNDFISSIRRNEGNIFKNKYRNADVLLIDDIQFLSNKKETQEEFFHTFNTLHEQGKQIVISSDRHPRDIAILEERLRSRFEGGLITDIQPPDLETRIAILQYKATQDQIKISDEALYFIANNVPSNIRELEGTLNRVNYFALIMNIDYIDLETTQKALQGIFKPEKQIISFDLIKKTIATNYNIKVEDLLSSRKDKSIAYPRQIAMYLCRELMDAPLTKIGEEFGGRDHTTVMHACNKIKKDYANDKTLQQTINYLKEKITK